MNIEEDFTYRCLTADGAACADSCESLAGCQDCGCVVLSNDAGGDWGDVMDVIFCLLPIIFLIYATIKPSPMSTTVSLPLAACLMFLVRVMYLGSDPLLTASSVILGLHEAWTPLSIMAGAITLFESMEATYCLPYMMREMKALTAGHPVAELMLIFCFAYMVEGASGFGTPVALGAPMLVSQGHPAFESVVVLLIMNTYATVWGAVGTPIWFGFGSLPQVSEDEYLDISRKAAVAMGVSAYISLPLVLTILVPFKAVRKNIVFIIASLTTCLGPSIGIAFVSYEFPSLLGGMIGCAGTAFLIKCKFGLHDFEHGDNGGRNLEDIGSVSENSLVRKYQKSASSLSDVPESGAELTSTRNNKTAKQMGIPETNGEDEEVYLTSDDSDQKEEVRQNTGTAGVVDAGAASMNTDSLHDTLEHHLGPRKSYVDGYIKETIIRTSPIWLVVLILIVTRLEQIGLKKFLTKVTPNFTIHFGTYGTFRLSASLVFQLRDILTFPGINWKYELLYVPFLIPFVLVSLLNMYMYRKDLAHGPAHVARTVADRLKNPAIALLGALVLVQLVIRVGAEAPATILGTVVSDWFQEAFVIISPLLGVLGSFFSGSTTVSNLTFGSIQLIAAESIGTSVTTMLALQAVGASAGNGVCLNNIIAACAVVGLNVGEGKILLQTYKFVFLSTTIATIVMLAFYFRFG
jgi:L-lactate permease